MRMRVIFFVAMVFFVASSASSWEGAAATSPEGELPANGLYVATNSFPRNTVVDIYNIETNKSTRAIVASGLNNPDLLAVVSREVAEIIGMRPGSISRIILTQPSDPIAYLRFAEGLSSGIPPYDSGNVITEDTYPWNNPNTADTSTARRDPPPAEEPERISVNDAPPYFLEPEWSRRSPRNVVDLPAASAVADSPEPPVEKEEVLQEVAEYIPEPEHEEEPPQQIAEYEPEEDKPPQEIVEYVPEEEDNTPQEIAEYVPEEEEEVLQEVAEYIPEPEPEEEPPQQIAEYEPEEEPPQQIAEYEPEEEVSEIAEEAESPDTVVAQYDIVPSQERPPQGPIYGLNPEDIIPQITRTNPEPVLEPMIESISSPERTPTESASATERTPVTDTNFSVPRIYELSRGSYYVQLAALDTPESVESAVRLIDRSYGPVVYKDGDNWYRILLGPLNQGESAAVLQRFRSIGYRDAFVRHVR